VHYRFCDISTDGVSAAFYTQIMDESAFLLEILKYFAVDSRKIEKFF
jgi:hypothetical protein